jgi:hypothetical protein
MRSAEFPFSTSPKAPSVRCTRSRRSCRRHLWSRHTTSIWSTRREHLRIRVLIHAIGMHARYRLLQPGHPEKSGINIVSRSSIDGRLHQSHESRPRGARQNREQLLADAPWHDVKQSGPPRSEDAARLRARARIAPTSMRPRQRNPSFFVSQFISFRSPS